MQNALGWRRTLVMTVAFGLAFGAAACRTQLVAEPVGVVPPGLTVGQVGDAIFAAASQRRWRASQTEFGKIRAVIDVRGKHHAEIEISFDAAQYRIRLVASENLLQSKRGAIHQAYNGWVGKLDQTIQAELLASAPKSE